MIVPFWYQNEMPCITRTMVNAQEETTCFQGGYGLVGDITATINIFIKNDEEMELLKNFWDVKCKYGKLPFLISLPIFGTQRDDDSSAVLAQFMGSFSANKKSIIWESAISLKVYPETSYIFNEEGEYVIADGYDTPQIINF
ncbi:MAG: hypothetical protein M0Q19_05095 [Candidatus Cloacimonetes bacterium]|nr:hypothetical protein [Candidatus Cloacimonadota bacterium]MCK9332539.1 hypothetical protein [Candidatus Cloacimonadota bacterium]